MCMYIPGGYKQRIYLQCRRFGFNPWVRKIPWRKEEMATHSSILAWRSPWTEKPGGLQPMGSHKSQTQLISWTTKLVCVATRGCAPFHLQFIVVCISVLCCTSIWYCQSFSFFTILLVLKCYLGHFAFFYGKRIFSCWLAMFLTFAHVPVSFVVVTVLCVVACSTTSLTSVR